MKMLVIRLYIRIEDYILSKKYDEVVLQHLKRELRNKQ